MGKRGEGWVVGQLLLSVLVALAPPSRSMAGEVLLRPLGAVLMALGVGLAFLSGSDLGRNLTPFPKPIEEGELVQSGVYGYVRHPIYLSLLLAAFGWALWRRSALGLLLSVLLLLFLDAKARHEEHWLREQYPDYEAYQARVKKLIPWLY